MSAALRQKDDPAAAPGGAGATVEPIRARGEGEGLLRGVAAIITVQDVIMLSYLTVIGVLVWLSPGQNQALCARRVYLSMAAMVGGCLFARGLTQLPLTLRAVVYRLAIVGVLLTNYLTLRDVLPLVRPDSVDDVLMHLDLRLFGVEPSIWLERYNQRPIIEWFSFFYFSYFGICIGYMVVTIWIYGDARAKTEYSIGTLIVFSLGQLGYIAVPGYGPIGEHMKHRFQAPINGGMFWGWVWSTVEAGGAMKDIFPSLHTAVPLWFALFAFHMSRRDRRWTWPARITAFFSANIIFSTMLLRWHYGVDVIAGLALATTAAVVSPIIARREEAWRASIGLRAPWCFEPARKPTAEEAIT